MFGFLFNLFTGTSSDHSSSSKKHNRRQSNATQTIKNRQKKINKFSSSPVASKAQNYKDQSKEKIIAYHGTPFEENAKSIIRDGWKIGGGNAHGDGIYFSTDVNVAKSYSGSNGIILKCLITPVKCAYWGQKFQNNFLSWCQKRKIPADNSAKTAFLLQNGFRTLMAGNIVVVLMPQYANQAAWKKKINTIKILSTNKAAHYK